ncbi:uncharacterized protein LOC143851834 isoform X2 [Tasmannia lanceolata]|uniref:uncharacterized protein LOC143851834 isoform X2 n=1 Tax=Tasmannia lanceolata TaxID=3420 RepID=UPI004063DA65
MPPEPLPWDRKDFFKEKKHERSDALAPVARWRDAYHGSRDFVRGGSEDLRRPPGPGKQGNYQHFPEESGHGCTSSRSSERMVEDESFRPSVSRSEGRYIRNSRENKGSFSIQKDWKGYHHQQHHSWEAGDALALNSSARHHDVTAQRSVDDLQTHTSRLHSDIENLSWNQPHLKDQHDKLGSVDGLGNGRIYGKDHSLGSIAWKPLKWTRSGSLSSRSSGFSHSTSSKSIRADSDDMRPELLPRKSTPAQSPSGDPAVGLTTAAQFEESCPRKKQRLGWGQGLAKYEKEKVEGPEEITSKSGLVQFTNSTKIVQNNGSMILPDRSPKVTGLSECTSPTSPCSVACSSSPGVEDKPYFKVSNNDIYMSHFTDSPGHGFPNCPDRDYFSLEHLELDSISSMSSRLANLLQMEDASSGDSNFVRSTDLTKLLLIKNDISKALEKTECEIDLLENELKSLHAESETNGTCPTPSLLLQADSISKPCKEQPDSAAHLFLGAPSLCNDPTEVHGEVKNVDIDSPGTVTSKCSEVLPVEKGVSSSDMVKLDDYSAGGHCFDRRNSADLGGEVGATCLSERCDKANVSFLISLYVEADCTSSILASNKDSARKANEAFDKLLPADLPQFDIWGATDNASYMQNNLRIREMLAMHNSLRRFKERALTLKFRAFHHMWKEDLRLLSVRKQRAKSQKRFELSCRSSQNVYQKHRSSIRSRFTSPGNLTLVPTTEIVDFTRKLLLDSQIKLYRNNLKMPALILDENDKRHSRFMTSNGFVYDPCIVEKERAMINPWTPEEKEIFMDVLATFGKDFSKIASFLNHKTTADCVEFYYKYHKSESFEKIRERLDLKKQGRCFPTNNYLVPTGKKWNRERNAASLPILGVAAHAYESKRTQLTYAGRPILGGYYQCKMSRREDGILERTSSANIPGNEYETAAADVLAGICGGLSSEAMSSCITSSVDPGEGFQEWKGQKMNYMIIDRPFTPELSQSIDEEDTCSDESCGEFDSVDWTDEEKSSFIMALRSYGRDFASISQCVKTRTRDQCKVFFSKARKSLGLDVIHPGPVNEGTPISNANGGRSDAEDACVVEIDSAICSTQSCSLVDVNLPEPLMDRGGSNLEVGNVVEKVVPDDDHAGIKQVLAFNGENNLLKGEDDHSCLIPEVIVGDRAAFASDGPSDCNLTMQLHEGADMFVDTEAKENGTCEAVTPAIRVSGEGQMEQSSNCDMELKTESEPQQFAVLDEAKLDGRRDGKTCSYANKSSSTCCSISHSGGNRNSSPPGVNVQPGLSFISNHRHQMSLEPLSCNLKSQIISWEQKVNGHSEPGNLALSDSSGIHHYEDHLHQSTQSTLNFDKNGHKQHQKYIDTEFYQQYLLGNRSLNRGDQSLQILKGYPLQVLNKNGDADLISQMLVVPHNISKVNRNSQSTQVFTPDLNHEKCNGTKSPQLVSEVSFLPKSDEQTNDQLRSCHQILDKQVRSSSEIEEQSLRTGDFKLFGRIVSNLSSSHKMGSPQENNEKAASPKSNQSFSLKFSEHKRDATSITTKLESSGQLGREEFPMTSHGFWDGNRIQTGLSSLPDSAISCAKYPSSISDYPATMCRIEQQPMSAVVRRNVNSNGGLADYQVYRSYEGTNMRPFSVDVNRQEVFSELPKQNGFETVLDFQQQGRGVVGMNVAGGGILVEGCNGVSDPVAAIKMHFATEKHFGEDSNGGDKGS